MCQDKASSQWSFDKGKRILYYIYIKSYEKSKEDDDFLPYDDNSYFFDTESKQYKELSAELQKVDIEKQEFLHKCETKYFNTDDIHFWDIDNSIYIPDRPLVKEFSYKYVNGRISYEVYNFYEKDTGTLLYSGKTRIKFSSFIYYLRLAAKYIPYPDIRIIDGISLRSYD